MKMIDRLKLYFSKIDKKKSIVFSFPILLILMVSIIVVLADDEPIRTVDIESNYSGPGSWVIQKSSDWIDRYKARITIDLESQLVLPNRNKDIVFVVDTSSSMQGSKLDSIKESFYSISTGLLNDSNNRFALITFSDSATLLSGFTNDVNDIDPLLDEFLAEGSANYNAALNEVSSLLNNYSEVNNKDLIVLFITDGYPDKETPNQISTYEIIKENHPYATINAIQFEMGEELVHALTKISDYQYVANEKTINNVILEASFEPVYFDSFVLDEYISDNFEISAVGDINASIGSVSLTTESNLQKVTWNLGTSYRTGANQTLTIDLLLKDEKKHLDELFETNDHAIMITKLPDVTQNTQNSTLTPILQGKYTVVYQTNTPLGCTLSNIENEKYEPFETVSIRTDNLSCSGFKFNGFDVEEEVTKINSNTFVMPGYDITIRGTWNNLGIIATMDGEVSTAYDLYKVVRNEQKLNNGYVLKYIGQHKDSFNRPATRDIYYYTTPTANDSTQANTLLNKINVIFGGYCWQMLRTTDTGGVKMIYNGLPVDGKCLNDRTTTNGLIQGSRVSNVSFNDSYAYGTDFTYDLTNGTFKIDGTIKENINYTNDKSIIGYYTCKDANKNATCSTLYYIQEESNTNTSPFVYPFTIASTNYAQIGQTKFNGQYSSPAYVGYMYNKVYDINHLVETSDKTYTTQDVLHNSTTLNTTYWYADSVHFGATKYELVNPYQVSSTSDYPSLVGKYTFRNTSDTYTSASVYYIEAVSGSTMYYSGLNSTNITTSYYYGDTYDYGETTSKRYTIHNATRWTTNTNVIGKYITEGTDNTYLYYVIGMVGDRIFYTTLSDGNKLKYNESLVVGDTISGSYTLNSTSTISYSDWITNYSNYKGKYTCGDTSTTCANPRYIANADAKSYRYINHSDEILISKTRNGLNLTSTLLVKKDELAKNRANYLDYKYTCHTTSSICADDTLGMILEFTETGYEYAKNIYFGESASWDGTKYILNDVIGVEGITNLDDLSTHHYTCINPIGTECTSVGYIFNYDYRNGLASYILLENGLETSAGALNEMLNNNNVNAIDSPIKRHIESWYYNNLLDYDSYLEETIYCNDRSIKSLNGWKDDGGSVSLALFFKEYTTTTDLSCTNETDKFSVSNNKAKLKYKVGLPSSPEMKLLNNGIVRKTGSYYWLGSPYYSNDSGAYENIVNTNATNNMFYDYAYDSNGVRPVISLKSGIAPSSGNGSMATPYIIDVPPIPYCEAGSYYDGTACTTCPANTYSEGGSLSCTACATGMCSEAGSNSCSLCQLKSYTCSNTNSGSVISNHLSYTGKCTYIDDGDGNWRIKFTSSGTATFSYTPTIDVFLVGGGGGGGKGGATHGGSGGGGGYTTTKTNVMLSADTSYTVTIGGGGSRTSQTAHNGGTGGTSSAFGFTASGGAGGLGTNSAVAGGAGGSGGGASAGGGATKKVTAGKGGSYGNNGGERSGTSTGGAGIGCANNNGCKIDNDICTNTYEFCEVGSTAYAAGGGGGACAGDYDYIGNFKAAGGGTPGGGAGAKCTNDTNNPNSAGNGSANTGSGGGGIGARASSYSGSGGSGIVVIRNKRN